MSWTAFLIALGIYFVAATALILYVRGAAILNQRSAPPGEEEDNG